MKVEIRNNSVLIAGYVNAVERYSKPLRDRTATFVERIKAGTFAKALKRNDEVFVLLNHDSNRILASTKQGAKLYEDNIGLRAEIEINDSDVVQKANEGKLVGWSFGFIPKAEIKGYEDGIESRTVTDLDLIEVSILDNTKSPAYYGTLIEAREDGDTFVEYRGEAFEKEEKTVEENKEQKVDDEVIEETNDEIIEDTDEEVTEETEIEETTEETEIEETTEETEIEETTEETEIEAKDEKEEIIEEERAIDYSSYEARIRSLKGGE